MRRELAAGIAAGAVGTVALNATSYLDMLGRGRSASSAPTEAAGKLTELAHVGLGEKESAANRREALGALLGMGTGLGVGAVYALLRATRDVPLPVAALGLGAAAMAGSDIPLATLGLAKPGSWDAASWASDVLPHLAYGIAAAAAYQLFQA
ncbi:MAG: hypothetical protein WKF82_05780 [Nocardioidaceae bacterium]